MDRLNSELNGVSTDEFNKLLGKSCAKKGMFEGELEIGQVSVMIEKIKPVANIMKEIIARFNTTITKLKTLNL